MNASPSHHAYLHVDGGSHGILAQRTDTDFSAGDSFEATLRMGKSSPHN